MTTCSYDLVKTLWPDYEREFRSRLHRAGLYSNVFEFDGEGLTLAQFHETLLWALPATARVEVWQGHILGSDILGRLFADLSPDESVLVNYQEHEDDVESGHWALLLPTKTLGLWELYSPGYADSDPDKHRLVSTEELGRLVATTDPASKETRGLLVIREGGNHVNRD